MTRKQPENAEDLYARYFPLARATAARFLQGPGSDEDAEEVADDVMLELLAHPEKYDGGRGGLSTYVCVLARSLALNRRRTLTRRACLPLEEDILVESGGGPDGALTRDGVRAAVLALSPAERRLFTLKYVYEYSGAEIAGELGVAEGAAHTRVCRLRAKLIRLLRRQGITGWEA